MTTQRLSSAGMPIAAGFPTDDQRHWPRATASAASSGVKWLSSASVSKPSAQRRYAIARDDERAGSRGMDNKPGHGRSAT